MYNVVVFENIVSSQLYYVYARHRRRKKVINQIM